MSPPARVSVSDLELAPVTHSPPTLFRISSSPLLTFPHTCQSPFRRIPHSRLTFLPTGPFRIPQPYLILLSTAPFRVRLCSTHAQLTTYSRPRVFARRYFRATASARGSITLVVVQSMDWEASKMKTTLEQRWMATKRRKCYSPLLGCSKGAGEPQLSVRFYPQNAYPALSGVDRSYFDAFETMMAEFVIQYCHTAIRSVLARVPISSRIG